MSSKIRWDEFTQRRYEHLAVANAINALDYRWHSQHSDKDGSEFTVEGLYASTSTWVVAASPCL